MKKKKLFTLLASGTVLLALIIIAGFFVFNSKINWAKSFSFSSSASSAKPSSSSKPVKSSSSAEKPATEDAYLAAMGTRVTTDQPLPVIGQVAVPDIGVNLPIFQDAGDTQILYGAGTVGAKSKIGGENTALASHHVFYISDAEHYLFSPLTGAKNDMMIYLTDKSYVYQYKIDSLFVVPDTDLSVLDPVEGKKVVTLIYCVNFTGPDRAIVRGSLISKKPFVDSDATVQSYFTAPFNTVPADIVGSLH